MKIEFNQAAMRKLEKDIEKKFEAAVTKHPFKNGDSVSEIENTLDKLIKSVGATINSKGLKDKAQEIFDKLNK